MGRANAQLAVESVGVGPGDRVVDIGCGPGGAARAAARAGAEDTGVDPAPVMLRLARAVTRGDASAGSKAPQRRCRCPTGMRPCCGRLPRCTTGSSRGRAGGGVPVAVNGWPAARHRAAGQPGRRTAGHGWTGQQAASFAEHCRTAGFATPRSGLAAPTPRVCGWSWPSGHRSHRPRSWLNRWRRVGPGPRATAKRHFAAACPYRHGRSRRLGVGQHRPGRALGDQHDRRIGVPGGDGGHRRRVDHAQPATR